MQLISGIHILACLAIIVNSLLLVVSFINLLSAPRLTTHKQTGKSHSADPSKLALLIPARNEECNIRAVVECALAARVGQIIVLDDNSNDGTFRVLQEILLNKRAKQSLQVIKGKPLAKGWLGKNWACAQLAQAAQAGQPDYLLFLDADVVFEPEAITNALNMLNIHPKAGLLSVFPEQTTITFGEKVVVSYMNWLLLSLLPLRLASSSLYPPLTAANGQFMLWRMDSYMLVGGHEAAKDQVVEDIFLAKRLKKKGQQVLGVLPGLTALGNKKSLVSCRMYHSLQEAFAGFSKNAQKQLTNSPVIFLGVLFTLLLSRTLWLPLALLNPLFLANIPLILANLLICSNLSKASYLWHGASVGLNFTIGLNSISINYFGRKTKWKDRQISG